MVFAVTAAGPLHLLVHLARVLGGGCKAQCVSWPVFLGLLCCTVHTVVVVCTHAIHGLHVLQPSEAVPV